MPLSQNSLLQWAECATCPDCEKILVLGQLPTESKRPFVQGGAQGWVIICRGCGCEFPVRHSEIFETQVAMTQVH